MGKEIYTSAQMTKTTDKIFKAGYNTDKAILNIGIQDILKIPLKTEIEMVVIRNLQKAIRTGKFLAFLEGVEIEEEKKK